MGFLGFSLHGPHGLLYYWYINPWYLTKVYPRILPGFIVNNFTNVKKIALSVFTDVFVYGLLYGPFMLTYCGMIKHYGDY